MKLLSGLTKVVGWHNLSYHPATGGRWQPFLSEKGRQINLEIIPLVSTHCLKVLEEVWTISWKYRIHFMGKKLVLTLFYSLLIIIFPLIDEFLENATSQKWNCSSKTLSYCVIRWQKQVTIWGYKKYICNVNSSSLLLTQEHWTNLVESKGHF